MEKSSEQEWPTSRVCHPSAVIAPYCQDPVDIFLNARRTTMPREAGANIHRHMLPQGIETGMHFSGNRTGPGTDNWIIWPEFGFGMLLRQILADGKAVPDREFAILSGPVRGPMASAAGSPAACSACRGRSLFPRTGCRMRSSSATVASTRTNNSCSR